VKALGVSSNGVRIGLLLLCVPRVRLSSLLTRARFVLARGRIRSSGPGVLLEDKGNSRRKRDVSQAFSVSWRGFPPAEGPHPRPLSRERARGAKQRGSASGRERGEGPEDGERSRAGERCAGRC